MTEMARKKAKAVRVPLQEAEPVRRYLRERHLLREDVNIVKDGTYLYLPVTVVPSEVDSSTVVTRLFEMKASKPSCYKDLVKIPQSLRDALPTSYDVVGDIILLKLPKVLLSYQNQIGEALLGTHPHIRTVCAITAVSGELRTRQVSIIAGEQRTLTTHTEYGLSFDVDVAETYFSPRLASERRRVASQVRPGETVVDMFAGVAPFSIMIARYANPRIVYAIDKNSMAVKLAKQNVKKNHVLERVEVICADAADVRTVVPAFADRIIMNLPFSAFQFFPVALSIAANPCSIHYYDILREEETQARIDALKTIAQEQLFGLTEISTRKIKSYTPREFYIGIDITATKRADVA
jgi:tRNA (guanine37-N1)-methyltransferase